MNGYIWALWTTKFVDENALTPHFFFQSYQGLGLFFFNLFLFTGGLKSWLGYVSFSKTGQPCLSLSLSLSFVCGGERDRDGDGENVVESERGERSHHLLIRTIF